MLPCVRMEILTVRDARQLLITWESWVSNRDRIVLQAYKSGVTKSEIFRLTGIARSTIDRIIEKGDPV
jgi:DNA-directed RNA polymerase specialized sigma subunit